jgi:hypothetical protein
MNLSGSFNLGVIETSGFYTGDAESARANVTFSDAKSYKITAGSIDKKISDFTAITKQVIANLEGGYFNPVYHSLGDSRYGASGETMFGIDRKNGGTINTSAAGVQFWKKIGDAQKNTKWKWNYIPPDPLQTELINLAAQMMEPTFNANSKAYLLKLKNGDKVLQLINQDGRLKFNFIYACWNGPGWFAGFAKRTVEAYNKGQKTADELLKVVVGARIDSTNIWVKGGPKRGGSSWSLINQGGLKIAKLVGLQVT